MSVEENKEIVRRFNEEAFGRGDTEAVDRYMAPDILNRATGMRGTENFKGVVRYLRTIAPDLAFTVEDLIGEGDRVQLHIILTGTHEGELRTPWGPIQGKGKRFSVHHVHGYLVVDGRIVEHWAVRDDLGMLQQLDALPAGPDIGLQAGRG